MKIAFLFPVRPRCVTFCSLSLELEQYGVVVLHMSIFPVFPVAGHSAESFTSVEVSTQAA